MHPHADSRNTTEYPFLVGDEVTQEEFFVEAKCALKFIAPENSWGTCFLAGVLWAIVKVLSSRPHFPSFGSTCSCGLGVYWLHAPWVPWLAQRSWGFLRPGKPPGNIGRKRQECSDSAAASLWPCTVVSHNAVALLLLFQCHITYKVQNILEIWKGEMEKKSITY